MSKIILVFHFFLNIAILIVILYIAIKLALVMDRKNYPNLTDGEWSLLSFEIFGGVSFFSPYGWVFMIMSLVSFIISVYLWHQSKIINNNNIIQGFKSMANDLNPAYSTLCKINVITGIFFFL